MKSPMAIENNRAQKNILSYRQTKPYRWLFGDRNKITTTLKVQPPHQK
jgi:hypothetical protein